VGKKKVGINQVDPKTKSPFIKEKDPLNKIPVPLNLSPKFPPTQKKLVKALKFGPQKVERGFGPKFFG